MMEEVFYYNLWKGVDLPEIRRCFRPMTQKEEGALEVGDAVWLDREPYHLCGKVYGFSGVTLTAAESRYGDCTWYAHDEGGGFLVRPGERHGSLYVLRNHGRLEELVQKHGELVTGI